jgi:hypothetical protein
LAGAPVLAGTADGQGSEEVEQGNPQTEGREKAAAGLGLAFHRDGQEMELTQNARSGKSERAFSIQPIKGD